MTSSVARLPQSATDHSAPARVDGRRVRNAEQTLQRLLVAARDVFAARGYERATVDEIVGQAGLSKGAFYNHFQTKEEVFLHVLERRGEGNRQRFLEVCRAPCAPADRALCVVETIIGYALEDPAWPALQIEFMAHAIRTPVIGERLARLDAEWRTLIADLLRGDSDDSESTSAVDVDTIALYLVALLDGLIMQAHLDPVLFAPATVRDRLRPLLHAWFPTSPS
jgi:TetR/AcrR family transcriptional regulator, transcriptional repressor for nem operon